MTLESKTANQKTWPPGSGTAVGSSVTPPSLTTPSPGTFILSNIGVGLKRCRKCHEPRPLCDFQIRSDGHSRDGYRARCRFCYRIQHAVVRPGRYDGTSEQRRARRKVRYAVRRGIIQKPNTCERCGKTFEHARLEGHHHAGYGEPLSVIWLCRHCHAAVHVVRPFTTYLFCEPRGGTP